MSANQNILSSIYESITSSNNSATGKGRKKKLNLSFSFMNHQGQEKKGKKKENHRSSAVRKSITKFNISFMH